MPDNWLALVAGPLVGGLLTYFATRLTARPAAEQALTVKFTALIDRQEHERVKLEKIAAELEVMVVLMVDWADQVIDLAEANDLELPLRPKFKHFDHVL